MLFSFQALILPFFVKATGRVLGTRFSMTACYRVVVLYLVLGERGLVRGSVFMWLCFGIVKPHVLLLVGLK